MQKRLKINDIFSDRISALSEIDLNKLIPLPPPYDKAAFNRASPAANLPNRAFLLDGYAVSPARLPKNIEDEETQLRMFIDGLRKVTDSSNNWTFLRPLLLSLHYCAQCLTCKEACHIYLASNQDLYLPSYRSEILRKIIKNHIRTKGNLSKFLGENIELNSIVLNRLYELSYRCNLCRRCAQVCPMGIDNALIAREIRKIFSQELGWAPQELHEKGSMLQLTIGSPTGMRPEVFLDNIRFIDEDFSEALGMEISTPVDREGADILLIHSAGDILSFPESIVAFTLLFNLAGLKWTLSSEAMGYEGVNYGLFYDDVQLTRIARKHASIARKLKVKKIVLGECGHEHKALMTAADRLLTGDLNIPRESCLVTLEQIVFNSNLSFDPSKNNFPVTLHDPCNIVRNLGIVEPQRRILRFLCPQFREMSPSGINNYCCGGGGGLSLIDGVNFKDWKMLIAGRVKFRQILEAFKDAQGPEVKKYVCSPCLNCKLQIRDMIKYYGADVKSGLRYGGLAELIANALTVLKRPLIMEDI